MKTRFFATAIVLCISGQAAAQASPIDQAVFEGQQNQAQPTSVGATKGNTNTDSTEKRTDIEIVTIDALPLVRDLDQKQRQIVGLESDKKIAALQADISKAKEAQRQTRDGDAYLQAMVESLESDGASRSVMGPDDGMPVSISPSPAGPAWQVDSISVVAGERRAVLVSGNGDRARVNVGSVLEGGVRVAAISREGVTVLQNGHRSTLPTVIGSAGTQPTIR